MAYSTLKPSQKEMLQIVGTFSLTKDFGIIWKTLTVNLLTLPSQLSTKEVLLIVLFAIIEWYERKEAFAMSKLFKNKHISYSRSFYLILVLILYFFDNYDSANEFIYIQL